MESPPRLQDESELPGLRELREAPEPPLTAGLDWALAIFCTFGAPPAMVLAGLVTHFSAHEGSPVMFWLAACGFFFLGLVLSARLEPMPPRRVFDGAAVRRRLAHPDVAPPSLDVAPLFPDDSVESEGSLLPPGLSQNEALEQLAKMRENGELSFSEYENACRPFAEATGEERARFPDLEEV